MLYRVLPGSNAERIGLEAGDVPVHLNDQTAPSSVDVADALEDVKSGSRIELLVARNNLPVELGGVHDPPRAPACTVLLSPVQLDFSKPVKVVANGRTVYEGKVEKDLRALLKYAAAGNDRTMLFGAEVRVDLAR